MNINRHNYEEFFLLYVDKELSAADRKAVEVFVQENPDLRVELALLQQTVMPVDDVVLQKKDWLYMEEDISALQENLLLYADDELNAVDKKAVESLLKTDLKAIAEFNMLQQTKLQPDVSVVFEDKPSLYRKEGGRVVGFKWWRIAAAAVLLVGMLWTGVSVYKNNVGKKESSDGIAKQNENSQRKNVPVVSGNEQQATNATEENADVNSNVASINQQNKTTTATEQNANVADKIKQENNTASQQNQNTTAQNTADKKETNNLPKPSFENINNNASNKTTIATVQQENNNSVRVSGSNDAVVKTDTKENKITVPDINNSKTNTNATLTAMQTTNEEDNNTYLNVDEGKTKRSALGGFLRKAKRVLERTANVKTGEGVKIAGFEIALK